MTENSLPSSNFKKNGSLHFRKCAQFYGVQPGTIRVWSRCGAPLLHPERMTVWRNERDRGRWAKIGRKNNHYADKTPEILRLYVSEKLGLRAIARYFSGRPSTAGIRKILIAAGVYRGNRAFDELQARSQARRAVILRREKELRHRAAVCLWKLRRGKGVETTCREKGWSRQAIWNFLGTRVSYKRLKVRSRTRWPDKRIGSQSYSRAFPREQSFQDLISALLTSAEIAYIRECRLPKSRTRVDFKLSDNTFVECKVALNAGQVNEFIGQATQYRAFSKRIVLCIPSDVQIRADLHRLIIEMGILICNELTFSDLFGGADISLPPSQVTPQRSTRFVCKCCGSTERRRHRMNSYCVDCAPNIPKMHFDYHLNRWIADADSKDGDFSFLVQPNLF